VVALIRPEKLSDFIARREEGKYSSNTFMKKVDDIGENSTNQIFPGKINYLSVAG